MSSNAEGSQSAELAFSRSLGLFDATMIGAGIFVLTGITAGVSGPVSILAFTLNGAVTLLSIFTYAELATAIPEAGGDYAYVRRAFLGPIGPHMQVDRLLIESESIAGGIARASKEFYLVVLGTARELIFRQVLFGEIPEKVARYSPASVLVVKQYEGHVRSIFNRIFG